MRSAAKLAPLTALLILAPAGPAGSQGQPPAGSRAQAADPTATFIFIKSYDTGVGPGRASLQYYYYLPAGTCRGKRMQAVFTWTSRARRQRTLPAGRPVTLWMLTNHMTNRWQSNCQNAATFTPRPGATYEVALRSVVTSHCQIAIVDTATGQTPDGVTYDNSLTCG